MIIGLGLLIKRFIIYTIVLLLLHMSATVFTLFILKTICFDAFPYCPSLVGQYIIKNLVLIAGALVISGKYNAKNSLHKNYSKTKSLKLKKPKPLSFGFFSLLKLFYSTNSKLSCVLKERYAL